jgi:quinohemoprotein amine dehydrogenase
MARVGGANFPKQYQQFEAVAYNNGADGKPDTKDDLDLGIVDVAWSLEEYTATFGDDDKEFVGTVDASGLFTPNIDGPNPKRKNQTNNYGDVWVVATFTPEAGGPPARPIRARAHLLVTVPVYMRWEPSEVTR